MNGLSCYRDHGTMKTRHRTRRETSQRMGPKPRLAAAPARRLLIANLELETPLNHSESTTYGFLIANKRRFFAAIHSFFHRLSAFHSAYSVLNITCSVLLR